MPILDKNTLDTTPTLFELAKRVRRAVTKEELPSLIDDPINNVIVDALNDAVSDIYYRSRWNWARTVYPLEWQSGVIAYALPGNFMRIAAEPVVNNIMTREVSPEEWSRNTYSPSWNSNSSIMGQPSTYKVDRTTITWWPAPSDAFIASSPTSDIIYYKRPGIRLTITDAAVAPDVPTEFTEALVCYAVSRLKVFLQYSDFAIDMDRYEKLILNRIQTDTISAHPVRMRPRNFRSANFG